MELQLQESLNGGAENTFFDGSQSIRHTAKAADWNARMADTLALVENHAQHRTIVWQSKLLEAMSTADFPALYSAVLDREMLMRYKSLPSVWGTILKASRLANFNTVDRYIQSTGAASLPRVLESGQYKNRDKSAGLVQYKPFKYGALTSFTFEGMTNDDLDFFSNTAQDFADSAMNTENRQLTSLFWDAAGAKDAFFNDGGGTGQQGVSALVLNRTNLEVAITEMMGKTAGFLTDANEPMLNTPRYLMVPPALQLVAEELLSPAVMITGTGAPTTSANLIASRGIQLVINPWMPIINTTNGHTAWALFSGTIKPGEVGRINGHEKPEIFIKSSDAMHIGGGLAAPSVGSFENDEISYKIRYIQGETTLDPRGGWASDGV